MENTIKERVKEVRLAAGISQAKFAKQIAVSPSFISEVEGGTRKINERAIRLIINEYNVNEEWLRNGQGSMFSDDGSVFVSEAMSIFKSLDKHFQEGALKMLSDLAAINAINRGA